MKLNIKNSRLEIHRATKQKALEYLKYLPEELREYQKGQELYGLKEYEITSIEHLINSIEKSQIIYFGDFHTFDQSSKNLERLLKNFFTKSKTVTLGVEFVHIKHQDVIDSYQEGLITEREFLESIQYKESWRFPWIHYKVFFELARKNNFRIIALNSEGTIAQRDYKAAEVINQHIPDENQYLFILFGELHILPDKLPKKVREKSAKKFKDIIVHQNLENLYWNIYEQSEQDAAKSLVVKFSDYEFSLQNSPPWIKYESMIYWYENLCDDPEFDLHEYIIETGLKSFNGNIYENFFYLCKKLNSTLDLNLEKEELENFNIYDHQSLDIVLEKINDPLISERESTFFQNLIHHGELFHIPQKSLYYCSSYSINRISILAGFHTFNLILNQAPVPKKPELQLAFFSYLHYLGYFSSKIFNPFRKTDLYIDLIKNAKNSSPESWDQFVVAFLQDREDPSKITSYEMYHLFNIGKKIGNLMAELTFFSESDSNFIFNSVIDHLINQDFKYDHLKKLVNETTSQTTNFFQTTKVLL